MYGDTLNVQTMHYVGDELFNGYDLTNTFMTSPVKANMKS